MSVFSGKQHKGAMRQHRAARRERANLRREAAAIRKRAVLVQEAVVEEQRAADAAAAARREIVMRYAKRKKAHPDEPILCVPTRAEQAGRVPRKNSIGNDGKVAYPDRAAAEQAARELETLGAEPLRAYRCGRSDSGHHHLTHDNERANARKGIRLSAINDEILAEVRRG